MDIRHHETKWSLSKTHEGDLSTYFIDQSSASKSFTFTTGVYGEKNDNWGCGEKRKRREKGKRKKDLKEKRLKGKTTLLLKNASIRVKYSKIRFAPPVASTVVREKKWCAEGGGREKKWSKCINIYPWFTIVGSSNILNKLLSQLTILLRN